MEAQGRARERVGSSNIPLGGASLEGASISRTTYVKHPLGIAGDTKEQQKYLRGSHFNFGNENFQGVPEYKASYVDQGFVGNELNPGLARDARGSHMEYLFDPGHQGNVRCPGASVYRSDISDRAKCGNPAPLVAKSNCHKTTFVMGSDGADFTTEMKAKYLDPGRSEVVVAKGRGEAPQLPIGGKGDYTTESRAQYVGHKPDMNALGASKEFSKDLRKSHFALGSEQPDLNTYYHLYYNRQKKEGEAARLDAAKLNDVKRSHFGLGDHWTPGITHYTDQHRWLQPVPREFGLNSSYSK